MDIRQALKTLEHNAAWVDRYVEFLASTVEPVEGGEAHHILPKALFPEFRRFREHPWNRIHLSPADHLLAHYYLYRAIPSIRTRFAFRMMVGTRALASIEHTYDEALVREVAETYAAAQRGFHHTPATRAKMSASQLVRHATHRSAGFTYGNLPRGDSHHRRIFGISDDTKAKISAALAGRSQDPVHIEKRRLKLIGQRKPWTQEARRHRSDQLRGTPPTSGMTFAGCTHSEEFKARRSAEMKALYAENPEHPTFTNKPSGADHWTYGKARPAETRDKISAALKGKAQTAATKQKRADALALARLPAYTEEEIALFDALRAGNSPPFKLTALSKGAQAVVHGLRLLLSGTATDENHRYWRQAANWLRLTGR